MKTAALNTPLGLVLKNDLQQAFPELLNAAAMDFIIALHEKFNHKRMSILDQRIMAVNTTIDKYGSENNWMVKNLSAEFSNVSSIQKISLSNSQDTEEVLPNTKQIILNLDNTTYESNAKSHQAVFELIRNGSLTSSLFFEPRSIAAEENNLIIHETHTSGALYDFGLFFFNNAYELLRLEKSPCISLSDINNADEAKWWNDVFVFAQSYLGLPNGIIKIQVNLNSITGLKNIDAIFSELKDHIVGSHIALRPYLASYIKTYFQRSKMTLPNLSQLSVRSSFLENALDLAVHTSHVRGIPCSIDAHIAQNNPRSIQPELAYIHQKGFDGIVINSKESKQFLLNDDNQISNKRFDVSASSIELDTTPTGTVTETGVKECLLLFSQSGNSIESLTENESLEGLILKQWINHSCKTVSGKTIDLDYCRSIS